MGSGGRNTLHHIFCTIVPFNSYFELNKSTTWLVLSSVETFKSEMSIFADAQKKHENVAVRFCKFLVYLNLELKQPNFLSATNTAMGMAHVQLQDCSKDASSTQNSLSCPDNVCLHFQIHLWPSEGTRPVQSNWRRVPKICFLNTAGYFYTNLEGQNRTRLMPI